MGRSLLPFEVLEIVERELKSKRFTVECSPVYLALIRDFIMDRVAQKQAQVRSDRGMFDALERHEDWDSDTDLSLGASGR